MPSFLHLTAAYFRSGNFAAFFFSIFLAYLFQFHFEKSCCCMLKLNAFRLSSPIVFALNSCCYVTYCICAPDFFFFLPFFDLNHIMLKILFQSKNTGHILLYFTADITVFTAFLCTKSDRHNY